jgi:type III secretion system FlhB-like substrate exporter
MSPALPVVSGGETIRALELIGFAKVASVAVTLNYDITTEGLLSFRIITNWPEELYVQF